MHARLMDARRRLLLRRWLLLALGAVLLGNAGYLHAKAWLAQLLLEQAWQRSEAGTTAARPWPWADTRPLARLRLPARGVDQIVLAGDSGRSLAFGPAWNEASAAPGDAGASVISGHRDTHFAFLRDVEMGEELELMHAGRRLRYRVSRIEVADARTARLATGGTARLVLVTCYPFDGWVPGGPLRYVVTALPVAAP
jgi:sortase A